MLVNKMNLEELWQSSLNKIEDKVGKSVTELWFIPIRILQIKGQEAIIDIPNRFFKDWIEDNYPDLISESIGSVLGTHINVNYKITEEKIDFESERINMEIESRRKLLAHKGIYINPKYTFENFVVGPSNQFAQAAAKSVSETIGKIYNPLFIYGGVGLGKTHLISAVGNAVIDKNPNLSVLYVSSEQFTNEVVSALRHDKMGEFKERYRNLDVLLLDDIQFIANKTATQEEFFHTFNTLYERQRQIVVSSDRPPKEITAVTDRLRSRFSMGLIADIQPPEIETKIAILLKKAESERINLPDEVAYYLASKIRSNIRELEGCLIRLGAQASLTGRPIDSDMAKSILKDIIEEDEKPITWETIQKIVCDYFGLKVADIKAKKRTKEVALPRQIAMYITKKLTEMSLSDIGKAFGGKDHATVIYACKQVEEKRSKDETFNRLIDNLMRKAKP